MTETLIVCACRNGGQPYELEGLMVISRDPSCKIHKPPIEIPSLQEEVERDIGDWTKREKEK